MSEDDLSTPSVTVRGVQKIIRQMEGCALQIKVIWNKGKLALTRESDRLGFLGMTSCLDAELDKYSQKWQEALEYSERHNLNPPFPSAENQAAHEKVRDYYYEAKGCAIQITNIMNPPPGPPRSSSLPAFDLSHITVQRPRTILPKIPIKPFSGDIAQWPSFKQLFTSLIINEPSLSGAEQFHYLVSYLHGPAYDSIKHIPVVEENFQQAWRALLQVYDDKRKIASTYLERMLSFKPVSGKPTYESLQSYLSSVMESITSMKNLSIPNFDEYLLCELALRSLDPITREAFEIDNIGSEFPKYQDLQKFVQNRCQVLRLTQEPSLKIDPPKSSNPKQIKSPNTYATKQSPQQALVAHGSARSSNNSKQKTHSQNKRPLSCFICKEDHIIAHCPRFKAATPSERLDLLRAFEGCRNCLHPFHKTRDCPSSHCCRECKARHHTDLHLTRPVSSTQPSSSNGQSKPLSSGFAGTSTNQNSGVLLGTVIAHIRDVNGNPQSFRGVLDPGSQFSFLTEECARKLKQSTRPFRGAISGVNQSPLSNIKGQISITFIPNTGSVDLQTEAVIVPSITPPLPQTNLVSYMWEDYTSYDLSDPGFTKPGPISFLIGADLYPDIVTGVPIVLHDEGPRLMQTVFGFVVIGRFVDGNHSHQSVSLMALSDLAPLVEKFWEMEEPACSTSISPEDEQCEQHFVQTHRRAEDGRYIVSLPFRSSPPNIVPNTSRALNCFYSLESRLSKNESLREEYCNQMEEYKTLGHMSPASGPPSYIIPHHAVFKDDGEKRKLRIVFDASFPTRAGSLNDHLLTGPKLQADIAYILLNFRRFTFVLSCDIVKMFRQIWLDPADRQYQQIVWRTSPNDSVQFYELNTVTFGLNCSPYLAQRVLRQHALNYQSEYPEASSVLLNSTYIDDIVAGSDTPEQLSILKTQLVDLLRKGGFELSKWSSNYRPLLEPDAPAQQPKSLDPEYASATRILGMKWDPVSDSFSYDVSSPPLEYTKRSILSTIARLYDPLGHLAPVTFYAKCILQHTWQLKLGWDEECPTDVKQPWQQFIDELPMLSVISIPRPFPKSDTAYQLICFCDASSRGYCAVAYLRSAQGSTATLSLIRSKTKLAPLKTLTIPRLELCGALLLAQLVQSIKHIIDDLQIDQLFCFTDSTIVLAWIQTPPHMLQVFVSNRVQQILTNTKLEWWHHIKGIENPADVGSRGISPAGLQHHHLWWNGPDWCCLPMDQWAVSNTVPVTDLPELKKACLVLTTVETSSGFIEYCGRHSSFPRFVRVFAYVKRFISNARVPKRIKRRRTAGPITSHEFRLANHHFIRLLQRHAFPEVFNEPSYNRLPLELRRLNVFVDHEGLIRVGGRLGNSPLPPEQKFPILLPARSFYTNLVINHYHLQNHHIGPSALLSSLRQQYWIPKAKNLIKHLKHKCVVCTRFAKRSIVPFMGDLPKSRFSSVRPFLITGVDFAGPFIYKISNTRKSPTTKAYLCLFVCMSTRALHLEVSTSLSVEGFLDAFDRFVARRGLPNQMISDGGTNFHGADNYLQDVARFIEADQTKADITTHTAHLGIAWAFNPPSSPHFGGTWEVSVRVVKNLLYKIFGNKPYTLPELSTIFTKIEGILNSRPIQPLSSSPEDLDALTPGHFLIGQAITALPEPDLSDIPAGRLNRWQLVRERIQYFWGRWRDEYLCTLQERQKWTKKAPNLAVGDLVLLQDADTSPARWPLARIIEVHPGKDSIVRVVTIKTAKGIYRRPAVKMIPLKLEDIHS